MTIVTIIGRYEKVNTIRIHYHRLLVADDNDLKHTLIYYPYPAISEWFSSLASVYSLLLHVHVWQTFNCSVLVMTIKF